MTRLPTRCKKYSVGKQIGGAIYVHRIYKNLLPEPVEIASKYIPTDFDYTVVKFVEKESCVSFVLCPEFDLADEPVVGDILRIDSTGAIRFFSQQADPFIYHHKWLFVMDDYRGFDVERSKSRSISWLGLEGLDIKRIGRKSYWDFHVLPKLADSPERWLTSTEMQNELQISSCKLCHLRTSGKINFTRVGNAFFYQKIVGVAKEVNVVDNH
jgi:hypothetical protein